MTMAMAMTMTMKMPMTMTMTKTMIRTMTMSMTFDIWHMAKDLWHLTHDVWQWLWLWLRIWPWLWRWLWQWLWKWVWLWLWPWLRLWLWVRLWRYDNDGDHDWWLWKETSKSRNLEPTLHLDSPESTQAKRIFSVCRKNVNIGDLPHSHIVIVFLLMTDLWPWLRTLSLGALKVECGWVLNNDKWLMTSD